MTTDLLIKDARYDLEQTLTNPPLNVLVEMNRRMPVSMVDIRAMLVEVDRRSDAARDARDAGAADAPDEMDVLFSLFVDEKILEAYRTLLWLARTVAGERAKGGAFLTLEEAADGVGMQDVRFVNGARVEDTDEDADDDETVVTPGASPVRAVGKGRSRAAKPAA